MNDNDLSSMLLNRIMYALMESGIENLNRIKAKLVVILADYKIDPKEEALVIWTEGKNDYYLKRFLLAKAVAGCTKRTLEAYQNYISRVFMEIGKDVDIIQSIDITAFLAMLMQRSSATNADNYRRALSSFYAWLMREELITKNPMNKVDSIKVRKKEKKAFSDIECELLRDGCRTARERAIVDMLLSTGCRVSELISIKIEDVKGDTINVLGKGEKWRNVYLNAKAQVSLNNYLAERHDSNPYIFPKLSETMRTKEHLSSLRKIGGEWYKQPQYVDPVERMSDSTVEAICRKLGKRCSVENVHPHRFRRTCATSALKHGMPIEQVSKMLGHEQLSTTQIYLDLGEDGLKNSHKLYVT